MMRRLIALMLLGLLAIGALTLLSPLRGQVRALLRPEPPAPITPLALAAPATPSPRPSSPPEAFPSPTPAPSAAPASPSAAAATAEPLVAPEPSATLEPSPTAGPVEVNGRVYEAYIPAATKDKQFYQYTCEFDAAWVIFATFGYDVPFEAMLDVAGVDERIEPYIEETAGGFVIHGGDITTRFSGDYTANFLARSTGSTFQRVFEHYGLRAEPVRDRAGVEAALRRGALIWMKTTVDFKPWRPAVWRTPEGVEIPTVLGNDHAVVAIGFNQEAVVIRDVLGPTSSNWQRPYEYEVSWATFLASWGAQGFDGLAVERPAPAALAPTAAATSAPAIAPTAESTAVPTLAVAAAPRFSYPIGVPGRALGDGFIIRHGVAVENTWYSPGNWHTGEDWYALEGDTGGATVYAAADGEVVYAGANYPGRVVILRHAGELFSMYGHLDPALLVAEGQAVTRGQPLGVVLAQRGARAPSHLHFEIRSFFTAPEVNGAAPRYSFRCGLNCPPGPGYWPIGAPELPAERGWTHPAHVIARRMVGDGAALGEVIVATRPVSPSVELWSAPPGDPMRQVGANLELRPGERLPLLGIWAGEEAPQATSALAYGLWYRVRHANGAEGWIQAAVPLADETGGDGRPASVGFNLFPAVIADGTGG